MKAIKECNYVAVLFISANNKVLLSPGENGKLTLPARMSKAEPSVVVTQFCEIFDIYPQVRCPQSERCSFMDPGGLMEHYYYTWVKVKHPEIRFLTHSRWCDLVGIDELNLSELARAALIRATADGAIPDASLFAKAA